MSKLSKLRGTNEGASIFSNDVDSETASIFARLQGKKTPPINNGKTGNRKAYKPTRWRLKQGETKELVILDAKFTFAMREHALKNKQGYWTTERCISDYDSCPVCGLPDHRPYDIMLLTVLDLTPWEKDGKTYEFTKRVLALKKNDYEKFQTIADMQGLRGVVLEMTRGYEQKESANGKPKFINKLKEEELIEAFGSPEKKYDSGFVLPANNALIPFEYKDVYPVPTRADLEKVAGVSPRPGSKEDVEDTPPWEEEQVIDLNTEYPEVD